MKSIRAFVLMNLASMIAAAQTQYFPPSFITSNLPSGTVGAPYNAEIVLSPTGALGPTKQIILIVDNSLPPGLSLGTSYPGPNGTIDFPIAGTPTQTGDYPVNFEAWEDCVAQGFSYIPLCGQHLPGYSSASIYQTLTISIDAAAPLQITTPSPLPNGALNQPYSVTFTASGGTPGYSWSFSGDYPPFLTGIGIGGEPSYTLSGTPTEVPTGPYLFTVTVKDSTGAIVNKQFSLAVTSGTLDITTGSPLPDAALNQAYGPFQFAATGGAPDYSWQLAPGSGPLPAGLSLNPDGALTGIPSGVSAGTDFQFTVQVTDAKGQKAVKNFQLTIGPAIPQNITLLDPVPLVTPPSLIASANLLQGSHVSTDPNALASGDARIVQGIAADGFSQIVIKIPTSQPGQTVKINLVGDQSCSSAGKAWTGGLAEPTDLTGLNPLDTAQTSVQAVSVSVANQAFAFAIYVSPSEFDCVAPDPNDLTPPTKERSVTLQITADGNSYANPQIQIVRPPVLLVHGLNSDASAWNQVKPVLDNAAVFQVYRADYSDPINVASTQPSSPFNTIKGSALGFTYNAPIVLLQLKNYLNQFRLGIYGGSPTNPIGIPVAAVQMDLVGHSMGGLVSRAMTNLGDYYAPETLNGGYIHKLITVGTPHLGSPYAQEMVKPLNECPRLIKGFLEGDYFLLQATTSNGQVIDGAMKELQNIQSTNDSSNAALYNLNHGSALRPLPTAMIAGVMPDAQVITIDVSPAAVALREICSLSSLADFLTSANYPLLMGSRLTDGLVTQTSAFNGLDRSDVFGAAHSWETTFLFIGQYLLEASSNVPIRIEQLLMTPTSSSDFVSLPQQ